MRALILSLICLTSIHSHAIEPDKFQHFGVSAALTTACSWGLGNMLFRDEPEGRWQTRLMCAFGVGMAGLAWEAGDAIDARSKTLDSGDLAANALGIATAVGLSWQLNF